MHSFDIIQDFRQKKMEDDLLILLFSVLIVASNMSKKIHIFLIDIKVLKCGVLLFNIYLKMSLNNVYVIYLPVVNR